MASVDDGCNNAETPRVYFAAALVRLCLLAFGAWQDSHCRVRYTDVDYLVYTDAARAIASGGSPVRRRFNENQHLTRLASSLQYERATYRYTPLLAALLVPNAWGKLLFCAADLLAARLAADVVTLSGGSGRSRLLALRVSLFNPLTFVISSRGSCDALLAMLLLACLKAALQGRAVACGAWLGAAAHFRVYPVAHAVPLALFFCLSGSPQPGVHSRWSLRRRVFPAFAFLASSALCFALLGAACFAAYGAEFIREAYLYHVGRSDPRHNFSPSFYTAYLRTTPSPVASPPPSSSFTSMLRALVAALPQASVVTAAGAAFARDPPAALFLQTFFFVAFNSVVTAQYFAWWACLAPLLLPALTDGHVAGGDADTLALFSTQRRPLVGAVTAAAAAWVAALAYWLSRAALLEFGVVGNEEHVGTGGPRLSSSTLFDVDGGASGKHDDEYAPVWRASLLFVWASILFGATMARALPARDLVGVAAPRHIKAA